MQQAAPIAIIPAPVKLTPLEGEFQLTHKTVVHAGFGTIPEARYMARELSRAAGHTFEVVEDGSPAAESAVVLRIDHARADLGPEGYRLEVTGNRITIVAAKPAGLFRATQTVRQLLPPEGLVGPEDMPSIPCVSIEDYPRFGWRGHLFDVCRHFFTVDEVKRAIDLIAFHKLNTFHWHLTEDQGWRIEIKRYPKLTQVGAWRTEMDDTRSGGFYTQDEVREVVEFAAERHINVVPEIELPGHSMAALASYPELGCTGGPYEVKNDWGVYKDVYCAGHEQTFEFLQNVLDEVLALFPSRYIHIGGDECPKERWAKCPRCQERIRAEGLKDEHELQSYFIRRFEKHLAERGRRLIGWDEILEGGLAPGAIVQSWRGTKGGIQAASAGHDVIMSPSTHCYLDYSYAATPLEKAYEYEPIPGKLASDKAHHVLGIEGNLWSEWVPDMLTYEQQVYPRLVALAEAAWSPAGSRDWADFEKRMKEHQKRLNALDVHCGKPEAIHTEGTKVVGHWTASQMVEGGCELEWDVSQYIDGPGMYEVMFWWTGGNAGLQLYWTAMLQDGNELSRDTHAAWSGYDKRSIIYRLNVTDYRSDATYKLCAHLRSMGGMDSNGDVLLRRSN